MISFLTQESTAKEDFFVFQNVWDTLNLALGLNVEPKTLALGQMIWRAIIIIESISSIYNGMNNSYFLK